MHFITYNRGAAELVKKVFEGTSTIHSLFMKRGDGKQQKLASDDEIEIEVRDYCARAIAEFLPGVDEHYIRKAARCIFKTLQRFMRSSHSQAEGFDPKTFGTCYYPAMLLHQPDQGKLPALVKTKEVAAAFYCGQAMKVWLRFFNPSGNSPPQLASYDSSIKLSQLQERRVPGGITALLVDEFQDLTPCILALIVLQARVHKISVYFAGDCMQGIYSFNGADPKYLMSIDPDDIEICDRTLTVSFRFGPEIASAANVVAFVKQKSKQPLKKHSYIEGRGPIGSVTSAPFTLYNRDGVRKPFTVIFHKNVTGFVFALKWIVAEAEAEKAGDDRPPAKFFLRGDGVSSGRAKFKSALKFLPSFLQLFNGGTTLDLDRWKGRVNLTYEAVAKEIAEEELGDYFLVVGLIAVYGNDVMSKVLEFEKRVLGSDVSEADADIILTTVHAAKGLEWDRVQVLDDFGSLAKASQPVKIEGCGETYFATPKILDGIELLYTALTRAKEESSLPLLYMELVDELDEVNRMACELAALTSASPIQVTPTSPITSPIGVAVNPVPVPAPVPAPSPVSPFVTAANAAAVFDQSYLGLQCTRSDVEILHKKLYLPLKAEQNKPVNNFGLVIDGWHYFSDNNLA